MPVSYTHLDVYKRQQQRKSDILSFSQLYSDIAFPIPVSEQF